MKNKIKNFTNFLVENYNINKQLIVCDVQPEYERYIGFDLMSFGEFINNYNGSILFLFNGEDTLGMINIEEYKYWLIENCGIDEDKIYNSLFYDKGYGFFRNYIDNTGELEDCVFLINYMIENDITSSEQMGEFEWDDFFEKNPTISSNDIRELLEDNNDAIHIPELIDYLYNKYKDVNLCGGGTNECMLEVELTLQVCDIKYDIINQYTY